jgi:hypothetical protein
MKTYWSNQTTEYTSWQRATFDCAAVEPEQDWGDVARFAEDRVPNGGGGGSAKIVSQHTNGT